MLEPESVLAATEDVMMKTPPSGFLLKVGSASFTRACCPLTLTACRSAFHDQFCIKDVSTFEAPKTYPALIPFLLAHGIEVGEIGELRPARIADEDVQAAKGLDRFLHALGAVGQHAAIASNDQRLDTIFTPDLVGKLLGGGLVVDVVDRHVASFRSEFADDLRSEASG